MFSIGDKVRLIVDAQGAKAGMVGMIVADPTDSVPGVQFEKRCGGHDCGGRGKDGYCWYVAGSHLERVGKGRPSKPTPVLFVVFYEEDEVDPIEKFYSREELNDWLKKASEDRSIRWDSIEIIEKPKVLKAEMSKSFRLKAA